MNPLTAPPPSVTIDALLNQAKTAVKQGNRSLARRLLHQVVRQDPQDFRGWLWLASVAQSPQASLEYVSRAEMLAPHNIAVQKARRWAEKRLAQAAPAIPKPISTAASHHPRRRSKTIRWLALALILLVLAGSGAYAWRQFQTANENGETAVYSSSLLPGNPSNPPALVQETAVPVNPTPSQTPQPNLPAKLIASTGSDQPRPTWTVTPTPSPTPTPTPTVVPTFVNPNYQDGVRPFGVGPAERWIDVNLTTQTLRAFEGDTVVFTTLISSGTWDHPTVTGQFRIWLSYESQTMDGRLLGYDYYLENVPYVMYFYQDYALHGTYWHNNFGSPMSHGCVNMETNDAAWIYNFATIGTVVNVHY